MNNNFAKEKVSELADLLMIGLTAEEEQMVFNEFEVIDANINKLNEIENLQNVKPMTHALDDFEVTLREDIAEDSVSLDDLLANCDDSEDGQVSVPKVVG